ncbi:MAG: phosphoribosylamine--glycine ligase, partial [Nitrospirae bacterium]|nr:phosphoribosylamine--glycine ligase [Nitrospirota bacterium]
GGREHAIVWALSKSKRVDKIYCCPGNAGISELAECLNIDMDNVKALVDLARYEWIDYTVVGPEVPLVAGIVDQFEREGLKIIGPTKQAARLEGSKAFAKDFMKSNNIPTANYRVFSSYIHAEEHIKLMGAPVVIKADGLAAGKGVFVAESVEEANDAIRLIMKERAFGDAGNRVVIEDCLRGEEASFMVFTDGTHIVPMASSQDHKRAFDLDGGPNTGGMGAYTPAPVIDEEMEKIIMKRIIVPTIAALRKDGMVYKGVLYAGLMIKDGNPYVLEYNCRMGDPETQAVLVNLETEFLDVIMAINDGSLDRLNVKWHLGAAITVVAASGGYPGKFTKGMPISGLEKIKELDNVYVFHSGTAYENEQIVTTSGRVLAVTAMGTNLKQAAETAYNAIGNISFEGMFYRKDIGKKAFWR